MGEWVSDKEYWEDPQPGTSRFEWQPIDSAPKDGRQILVTILNDGGPFDGEIALTTVRWLDGVWCAGGLDNAEKIYVRAPLHWMPLPDPPARVSGEPE